VSSSPALPSARLSHSMMWLWLAARAASSLEIAASSVTVSEFLTLLAYSERNQRPLSDSMTACSMASKFSGANWEPLAPPVLDIRKLHKQPCEQRSTPRRQLLWKLVNLLFRPRMTFRFHDLANFQPQAFGLQCLPVPRHGHPDAVPATVAEGEGP